MLWRASRDKFGLVPHHHLAILHRQLTNAMSTIRYVTAPELSKQLQAGSKVGTDIAVVDVRGQPAPRSERNLALGLTRL